jgi:tRNA-binding protein
LEPTVTFDEFLRIDIRVGLVLEAAPLPGARRPAYRLKIDFGPGLGTKQSSAQLTDIYPAAELVGRQVVAVVNFAPKRIAGLSSEVLVLGLPDEAGRVVLLAPEREVPLGGRIY